MYAVMDHIIAFSKACADRIAVLNDTPMPPDRTEYNEGLREAIGDTLEKIRDELDDHVETGTFMTPIFNANSVASAQMFFELLIEQETGSEPQQEATFDQEDGTCDTPPDDNEEDDSAPADDYDFLEYADGLAEGDAQVREKILPDILATYERFLAPQM